MLFWVLLFFTLIVLSFIFRNKIYVVWFFLWAIVAFRYQVGTDYLGYIYLIDTFNAGNFPKQYAYDFGLLAILNFMQFVNGAPQMLFFIYAIFNFLFIYYGFKYFSKNNKILMIIFLILFSTLLLFQTLSIIRFMLAGAILFFSSRYIIDKKFIKYFFSVLVAMLFHPTALAFLPLYILTYLRVNFKLLLFFIIMSSFILIFHPFNYIIENLVGIELSYVQYLTNEKLNIKASLFSNINTLILFVMAFSTYKYFEKGKINQFVFLMFLIYILIRVLSYDIFIFQRLSWYARPFLIVYLGYLFLKIKINSSIQGGMFLLLLLYMLSFLSLFGLSKREGMQGAFYTQYSVDVGLFGKPYPINIYGDLKSLPKTNMERR